MGQNLRGEYRTPITIIVDRLQFFGQPTNHKGYIREISASGCRMEARLDFQPGHKVAISFVLPDGNVIVNAGVEIIRVLSRRKGLTQVAGQFLDLSEMDQYKIREFIVRKEAQEEA